MNSETSAEPKDPAFLARLRELVGDREPFVWAREVGIPSGTFDRIWNKGAMPKAAHLIKIARHEGVTLDWLLTGEGPKTLADAEAIRAASEAHALHALHPGNTPLDPGQLRQAIIDIELLFAELKAQPGPHVKADTIVWLYRRRTEEFDKDISLADLIAFIRTREPV